MKVKMFSHTKTTLDITRNEASEFRNKAIGTTEGTITCGYCGFTSDNSPELEAHKADAHDGRIFQGNQYEVTNIY